MMWLTAWCVLPIKTTKEPAPAMIAELKKVLPQEIVNNEKKIFDVKLLTPEEQMAAMMEMMGANK